MIRLGLCCIFTEEPIRFRQTTAAVLKKLLVQDQLHKVSDLCLHNLQSLHKALQWVDKHNTRAFRILSPIFPRMTHPEVGYSLEDLPQYAQIQELCSQIHSFQESRDIRLSLHPDQFNVLSSPHDNVIKNSLRELEYQGQVAQLVGATEINIHGGGVYGDKESALGRFRENFRLLSKRVQSRLTVENDDISYSPKDLFPLCDELKIPLVYDIHHHRCLEDGLSIEFVTDKCLEIWKTLEREPFFHISSPKNGYESAKPRPHADYIDIAHFPQYWLDLPGPITVDIEAKAKELAVLRLQNDLQKIKQE